MLPDSPITMTGGGCGLNRSLELLFAQNAENFTPYPGAAVSYPVIEQWASIGIGAGILPHAKLTTSVANACRLLVDDESDAVFEFHWIWKPDLALTPHVSAFHDHIHKRVPLLVKGRA